MRRKRPYIRYTKLILILGSRRWTVAPKALLATRGSVSLISPSMSHGACSRHFRFKPRKVLVLSAYIIAPWRPTALVRCSLPSGLPPIWSLWSVFHISLVITILLVCDLASWSVWVNQGIEPPSFFFNLVCDKPDPDHCLRITAPVSRKESESAPPVDRASRTPCAGKQPDPLPLSPPCAPTSANLTLRYARIRCHCRPRRSIHLLISPIHRTYSLSTPGLRSTIA